LEDFFEDAGFAEAQAYLGDVFFAGGEVEDYGDGWILDHEKVSGVLHEEHALIDYSVEVVC